MCNQDCPTVDYSGSRVVSAVSVLQQRGVKSVFAFASHAVFSGDTKLLQDSDVLHICLVVLIF